MKRAIVILFALHIASPLGIADPSNTDQRLTATKAESEKDSLKCLIEELGFSIKGQNGIQEEGIIKNKVYYVLWPGSDEVLQIGYERFSSEEESLKEFEKRKKLASGGLQPSAPFHIGEEIYTAKHRTHWTYCVRLKKAVFWFAGSIPLTNAQVEKVLLSVETEMKLRFP